MIMFKQGKMMNKKERKRIGEKSIYLSLSFFPYHPAMEEREKGTECTSSSWFVCQREAPCLFEPMGRQWLDVSWSLISSLDGRFQHNKWSQSFWIAFLVLLLFYLGSLYLWVCIVQQLITFRLRGDDDYRLSVLLAQTETLMRWRVLCDSGQVTSQVTRKSAAHQHSFAVLACATFFWDVFVLCTYSCVHIFSLYYCRCVVSFFWFVFLYFISLSTCQSLIYVRHSSAFFFLVVCLCVLLDDANCSSLSCSPSILLIYTVGKAVAVDRLFIYFFSISFFCFFFIFKRISMTAP